MKYMIRFCTFFLVGLILFFTACSDDDDNEGASIVGLWEVQSFSLSGTDVFTALNLDEINYEFMQGGAYVNMQKNNSGKCSVKNSSYSINTAQDEITVNIDGNVTTLDLDLDNVMMTWSGQDNLGNDVEIVLERTSEDRCNNVDCTVNGNCYFGCCICEDGWLGDNCDEVDIQYRLDNGMTPMEIYNTYPGLDVDDFYGKVYLNGLIFFLDVKKFYSIEGMVASLSNLDLSPWGCNGTDLNTVINVTSNINISVPGAIIGSGSSNTDGILESCTQSGIAAKLCRSLGTDWFLPSAEELRLMKDNLDNNGIGDFRHGLIVGSYWCSTEFDEVGGWIINFNGQFGSWTTIAKFQPLSVRAAKYF